MTDAGGLLSRQEPKKKDFGLRSPPVAPGTLVQIFYLPAWRVIISKLFGTDRNSADYAKRFSNYKSAS